jgi:hypothetical protein
MMGYDHVPPLATIPKAMTILIINQLEDHQFEHGLALDVLPIAL